ncbi:MAG: twin-arginine translocase TatA/TatE family subunit [Candidatus Sulfotelmatobacter sp.]
MSFSETIFLFFLALIIFGPKKLPEIARQAGRLLAELRRASNEFKSQIETEIAHLEVQKSDSQKDQTVLPPGAVPPGTVASLGLSPAAMPSSHSPAPAATLAEPTGEAALPANVSEAAVSAQSVSAQNDSVQNDPAKTVSAASNSTPNSAPASEEVATTSDSASQASHV